MLTPYPQHHAAAEFQFRIPHRRRRSIVRQLHENRRINRAGGGTGPAQSKVGISLRGTSKRYNAGSNFGAMGGHGHQMLGTGYFALCRG